MTARPALHRLFNTGWAIFLSKARGTEESVICYLPRFFFKAYSILEILVRQLRISFGAWRVKTTFKMSKWGKNAREKTNILCHSIPVVNLNSNRTCLVCTGLPENSVYWPDPMVQYVALTRLTYDRDQFSWHSPVRGLTMTTPMARSDFLQYPA